MGGRALSVMLSLRPAGGQAGSSSPISICDAGEQLLSSARDKLAVMPRTSQGLEYKLRESDFAEPCIVCGANDGQPALNVVMPFDWTDKREVYAFPVCSLLCVLSWTELIGRTWEGEVEAAAIAIAMCSMHERD